MMSFLSQHQTSVSYSIDVSSEHLWEINELISKMSESSFTYTQSFSQGNLCCDRIANYRCTNSSMLVVKTVTFSECCKSNILHADNCISVLYGDVFGAYSCFVDPTKTPVPPRLRAPNPSRVCGKTKRCVSGFPRALA